MIWTLLLACYVTAAAAQPRPLTPAYAAPTWPSPPSPAPHIWLYRPALPAAPQPAAGGLWLVNARRPSTGLQVWRFGGGRWWASTLEEFLAAQNRSAPTCFWVHGNRVNDAEAVQLGMHAYGLLASRAPIAFRFVIWSWPSEAIIGPLRDVREKALRSDEHAYSLAQVASRIAPDVPVSMIGYSYGSRLLCGAAHLAGGGQLAGRMLPAGAAAPRTAMRAVLIAASMDNNSLQPGQRNGQALARLEQVLIVVNAYDPVLRWYPMMYAPPGPEAMGHAGAAGVSSSKIIHLDLSRPLGRVHDAKAYLACPSLLDWAATQALFAPN